MKKYLFLLFILFIPVSSNAACVFGHGSTCPKDEVKSEEQVQKSDDKLNCYYLLPLADEIHYMFKLETVNECPDIFQVGYINSKAMKGIVMKENLSDDMKIFFRTDFESEDDMEVFIKKTWPNIKNILYRNVDELR